MGGGNTRCGTRGCRTRDTGHGTPGHGTRDTGHWDTGHGTPGHGTSGTIYGTRMTKDTGHKRLRTRDMRNGRKSCSGTWKYNTGYGTGKRESVRKRSTYRKWTRYTGVTRYGTRHAGETLGIWTRNTGENKDRKCDIRIREMKKGLGLKRFTFDTPTQRS